MKYNYKPGVKITHRVEVFLVNGYSISSPAHYDSDEQAITEGIEEAKANTKKYNLKIKRIDILKYTNDGLKQIN